ncbi:hypermethylated in cancer 2 protein-like [Chanos chanos]|uniref:Hypermethylated in cancer 2 protein n=1 Tax=Chanos chanos TaxID=29144 RepID=A0A6J2WTH4_CHACN|nr:hypermethylated in cancer 2 protein-like [Chanos chanos]
MELPNYAQQLLLQLNQQRSKGLLCDVIILVENSLFRAHKSVLAASSNYFKSLVLHDNLISLDTEMVEPAVFQHTLDFIYTGRLEDFEQKEGEQKLKALLSAANYLQLSDLAALCESRLSQNGMIQSRSTGGNFSRKPKLLSPLTPFPPASPNSLRLEDKEPLLDYEMLVSHKKKNLENSQCNVSNKQDDLGLDLSKKSIDDVMAQEPPQSSGAVVGNCKIGSAPLRSEVKSKPQKEEEEELLADGNVKEKNVCEKESSRDVYMVNGCRVASHSTQGFFSSSDPCREVKDYGGKGSEDRKLCKAKVNYVYRRGTFPKPSLNDNLYVCIPCGKGFPTAEKLNSHVQSHVDEDIHMKEEEEEEGDEEDEVKDLPSTASKPAVEVSDLRPFQCTSCSRSYKDPATLQQHEKTHWLCRSFSCDICGKMFTQRGTMTRHMRSHLGLKPFACEECGMRFTRQYRLTEHMRVHSGEKPYECQICGGKFTQQRNLISHLRMHTSSA